MFCVFDPLLGFYFPRVSVKKELETKLELFILWRMEVRELEWTPINNQEYTSQEICMVNEPRGLHYSHQY